MTLPRIFTPAHNYQIGGPGYTVEIDESMFGKYSHRNFLIFVGQVNASIGGAGALVGGSNGSLGGSAGEIVYFLTTTTKSNEYSYFIQ